MSSRKDFKVAEYFLRTKKIDYNEICRWHQGKLISQRLLDKNIHWENSGGLKVHAPPVEYESKGYKGVKASYLHVFATPLNKPSTIELINKQLEKLKKIKL